MTRTSIFACLASALLLGTALPATAQGQVESDRRGDIVVEGARTIDEGEAGRLARDVTGQNLRASEPLARFQRPVCPGIWGLSPANAQVVIDRIYDNATRAGVEVNVEPDCPANLWVIFVDDPRQTFADLRDEEAFLVRGLDYWRREAVEDQQGPVLAWNVVSVRNAEGVAIAGPEETARAAAEARSGSGDIPVNAVTTMSRTHTAVRQDIDLSVMLVQRSAIAGLDALAVGDYASMRLLAQTLPPEAESAYETVLSLFDESDASPPDRLTDFDLAYLQSLYMSRADRPGTQALRNVDELMELEARRQ